MKQKRSIADTLAHTKIMEPNEEKKIHKRLYTKPTYRNILEHGICIFEDLRA